MKRLFSLLCVAIFVLSLFSCNPDSDDDENEDDTTATEQTTTSISQSSAKEFSVSVLADGENVSGDLSLADATAKTLSFSLADSSSAATEGLPAVSAKWQLDTASPYISLSAKEGSSVQVTNQNYSDSVQSVTIVLSITPEGSTYKAATAKIKVSLTPLPKKDITAAILYGGVSVSDVQTLSSAADVLLSYSLSAEDEITVTSEWKIESGSEYVAEENSDEGFKVSNVNCSGESKSVTVKLTLTPGSYKYNSASLSITFNVADSTEDLQPGEFSASVVLGTDASGYDGTVRISWTAAKNAETYYIYRNSKQIGFVEGETEYIDKTLDSDSNLSNGETTITYYVKAIKRIFTSETEQVQIDVEPLIPAAPINTQAYLKKDGSYYYVDLSWTSSGASEYEVYRLIGGALEYMGGGGDVVKNGILLEKTSDTRLTEGDYSFVNEITAEKPYVIYVIVATKTYSSTEVTLRSKQSEKYGFYAGNYIGQPSKPSSSGGSSSGSWSSSSSSTEYSISISASKCIVYNRYSYCTITLPYKPGVTYKVYRCVRMSTNFGTPSKSDFTLIGSTSSTSYHDGDVCNQYLYENKSASGKYYKYMYYYVEGTDSSGNTYVSDIVKAE